MSWARRSSPEPRLLKEKGVPYLGRSVGPCKKYGFLDLLTRAEGVRGAPGGPPELSVGLPGASGGLPEAPGT